MPFWLPLAVGGAQAAGAIVNSIDDSGPDIDEQRVRDTMVNPFHGAAAEAAAEGAERIAGAPKTDPWLDALQRQRRMRQLQDRYMSDLKQYAFGQQSLAQEQMRREQVRLRQAMQGEAASARGDYARQGAAQAAPIQKSLLGARMVAPTQAMMEDEQNRAMQMYQQALMAQGRQDEAEMMQQVQQQRLQRQGLLGGEERRQYGTQQGVTAKGQTGKLTLHQERYDY